MTNAAGGDAPSRTVPPETSERAAVVEMCGITKRFARLVANDAVDFAVSAGEIHGLVGENGAGKSTLMKILAGFYRADRGEILLSGKPTAIRSPRDALRRGIGMVHQHFMLVPPLSVAENVVLGAEGTGVLGGVSRRRLADHVAQLAQGIGLAIDPVARVESLSVGQQQRVEILKVLYHDASILVLDEPTAVLTPQETDDLFRVLRTLRAEGKTIVLISHRLGEVLSLCDRISVMRGGRMQAVVNARATTRAELAQLMVGRPVLFSVQKTPRDRGAAMLRVAHLTVRDARGLPAVKSVSFDLATGEILGIAGVEGNGQTELVEALTGLRHPSQGTIAFMTKHVESWSPRKLHDLGLGHVPEDRQRRGLILDYSVAENASLGAHRRSPLARFGFLRRGAMRRRAEELTNRYDIRPSDPALPVRALSGGNQQKVVIAREFEREAVVLICAQPTRGVDVGAIEFIHAQILAQRDMGRAVLLVSADLSEILSLSDRIGVMYDGRLVDILDAADTNERELGMLMTGGLPTARLVKRVEESGRSE
jgi:simple sugar transport system ATP-binding protein